MEHLRPHSFCADQNSHQDLPSVAPEIHSSHTRVWRCPNVVHRKLSGCVSCATDLASTLHILQWQMFDRLNCRQGEGCHSDRRGSYGVLRKAANDQARMFLSGVSELLPTSERSPGLIHQLRLKLDSRRCVMPDGFVVRTSNEF
jgi:hypothetical protein